MNLRLVGLFGAFGLLLVLGATKGPGDGKAAASEEGEIKAVIEAAYIASLQACLESSHDDLQTFKDAMIPYYSDATRTPSELARRTSTYGAMFPTVDASVQATDIARLKAEATADPEHVPAYKLDANIDYTPPAPHYAPADSPLEDTWRRVDHCHDGYGIPGGMPVAFEVTGFTFEDVTVRRNTASADVLIDGWTDWLPDGHARTDGTMSYRYKLEKFGDHWKISGRELLSNPMTGSAP